MRINPCFTNIPVAPWIVPRIRIRSSIFMVHFRCPGLLRRRAATFISLLLTCKYALRLREYRERSRPSGKWTRGGDRVESSPSPRRRPPPHPHPQRLAASLLARALFRGLLRSPLVIKPLYLQSTDIQNR